MKNLTQQIIKKKTWATNSATNLDEEIYRYIFIKIKKTQFENAFSMNARKSNEKPLKKKLPVQMLNI